MALGLGSSNLDCCGINSIVNVTIADYKWMGSAASAQSALRQWTAWAEVGVKNTNRHVLVTSNDGIPLEEVKKYLSLCPDAKRYKVATNSNGDWVVGIFKENV